MTSVRSLILWPTAACNLDCRYCYRRDPRGGRMSPQIADAAVDLAERSATARTPVQVQLAGGEPTLVPDLVAHVAARVAASPRPMYLALQTNGTRLEAGLAEVFRRFHVQVGVSLDGPPDVHDQLRGRAQDTLTGLDLLAAAQVPVRVTAVLTAVNAHRLGDLAVMLAAYPNVVGLALDPLVPLGAAAGRPELAPQASAVRDGATELYHRLKAINRLRGTPLAWRELDLIRRARARARARSACGQSAFCHAACGQSLAITPDGRAYPCSQSAGDPASAAGTVAQLDTAALRSRYAGVRLTGSCHDCAARDACPGDCPSRVAATAAAGWSADSVVCALYDTLWRLEDDS